MDNYQVADTFSLLSKLMDIHGDNSFKSKSYSIAAFQIEKLNTQLENMDAVSIAAVKGIGDSMSKKIVEMLATGGFPLLQQYLGNTPEGVVEMLSIKGIGPKKINTIWKEMEIESIGELLYACNENRLTLYKGFGAKTQENVKESIEFYLSQQGFFLYQQAEQFVNDILQMLLSKFPTVQVSVTGNFRRQIETLEELEFVISAPETEVINALEKEQGISFLSQEINELKYKQERGPIIKLYCCTKEDFGKTLFFTTGRKEFSDFFENFFPLIDFGKGDTSDDKFIFEQAKIQYILPCLREDENIIEKAKNFTIPSVIQPSDINGIIHSHSTWSDGSHTLEQMATNAIQKGLEYLVISDHSRTAAYANGLTSERVAQQHIEIDQLNKRLVPFKIFKSIESDILLDGNLDYSNEVLASFDMVIASVHSVLKMSEEKAMMRLMKAIENQYTTILGHMTGRLLLSRNGYPVDHKKIIDACAANDVVIELNAHPRRLDMSWRWIPYAVSKGVLISIDPDAHTVEGYDHTKYGVLAAQKGMLTAENNLSSFDLTKFEAFLKERKQKKGV